ncbi:DnaJ-domain-containing protein [Aaosphaeria arxii CBS 175.79]|uniref:DnaJ-domain-containing protein n=1 Tax=Aaosphaeria arxii CBS 175.79 TaxID=1450172 RepID=A0A6A5Y7Y4_9PLEO|nr:DnaJ-domain-containing protein [Aaosphaeria arxii CBS 175.79]KAF2021419.1 DnaJ-domain-containing protein [Aaosphaeria arxii CBS 175.79]
MDPLQLRHPLPQEYLQRHDTELLQNIFLGVRQAILTGNYGQNSPQALMATLETIAAIVRERRGGGGGGRGMPPDPRESYGPPPFGGPGGPFGMGRGRSGSPPFGMGRGRPSSAPFGMGRGGPASPPFGGMGQGYPGGPFGMGAGRPPPHFGMGPGGPPPEFMGGRGPGEPGSPFGMGPGYPAFGAMGGNPMHNPYMQAEYGFPGEFTYGPRRRPRPRSPGMGPFMGDPFDDDLDDDEYPFRFRAAPGSSFRDYFDTSFSSPRQDDDPLFGESRPKQPVRNPDTPDLYAIMGLPRTAKPKEIEKKYKELMMKYHPNRIAQKGGSEKEKEEATKKCQEVNQANDVLSNPRRRAIYDQTGEIKEL